MEREATHDVVGKFFEHGLTFILGQWAHIQGETVTAAAVKNSQCDISGLMTIHANSRARCEVRVLQSINSNRVV